MFPDEKIEEWIQEVTERPSSAPLVIQFIANRLNELSQWNEKLREENIALRTEKRVQDYEQQIKHLTYQLELLKRQFGGELPDAEALATISKPVDQLNLLVYDSEGRIARWNLDSVTLENENLIGNLNGLPTDGEPARLLVAPASEELLCVFTSGRIAPLPVASIPVIEAGADPQDWEQVHIPREPGLGEALASLMTVSKLALSDFIMQISRRGFMKKIRMALVASIMDNLYIGTGAKLPGDQTMDVLLAHDSDRYVLVSEEGYLQLVTAEMLSFAVEEAVRLNPTDHLVAALAIKPEQSMVVMTQVGKAIHRTAESIQVADALKRKGKALYSKARREKGVRVVGGGAVDAEDWGLALHQDGAITLYAMQSLLQSGTIPVEGELLAFVTFPDPETSGDQA
jgi:DNA gyrase/topoisomerase IV subunit A